MRTLVPYTILLLAYRLPSLSPAAFKNYYETYHMPLLQSIAGPLFPNSHTRHYIYRDPIPPGNPATIFVGVQQDFQYDAIAELTFDNETAFQAFSRRVNEPEPARRIALDEAKFLDRSKLKAVLLETTQVTRRSGYDTDDDI